MNAFIHLVSASCTASCWRALLLYKVILLISRDSSNICKITTHLFVLRPLMHLIYPNLHIYVISWAKCFSSASCSTSSDRNNHISFSWHQLFLHKSSLHEDKMSKEAAFYQVYILSSIRSWMWYLFLYIFLAYQTKHFDSITRWWYMQLYIVKDKAFHLGK